MTPDTGYHVADVLVDGASTGAAASCTLSGVTRNRTIHALFELNPAPTLTSPNAGDLLKGTTQNVSWTVNTPVSSGYFRIWLRDASTGTWVWGSPTADAVQAVAGQTTYSMNWSVAQQPGTYKLWVYYYNADGTQIAGDDSSGTITINPAPTLTSPNSGSIAKGNTQMVTWTMTPAVSSGYFRIWLQDASTGTWVWGSPTADAVQAVAGQTTYSMNWSVAQQPGTYKLWVWYYEADGTQGAKDASNGTITINPAPTLTSPNSGNVVRGNTQAVTWTMTPAVSSGYFRIWVQDASTGTLVWGSPTADAVQAVAGQTSYGMNWSVAQGAGTYKLWVYYYNADGTQAAKDVSNGTITINPAPTLTSPNAGDLLKGTTQNVSWTVNTPVSSGYFRIWLRDASTGTWVWGSPTADAVQAVAGQTTYSMNWSVAQQPGTYKLWVYYYNADGTQIAGDDSSGTITINPAPTLTSPNSGSIAKGNTQMVTWTMTPAVSSGYFRIWLQDASTGTWVWGSPTADAVQAVAGQTTYSMNWSVAQQPGTYKLWVWYYEADGTQGAKDASNGTITINPAPTLTSPNSGNVVRGNTQAVTWTMTPAVSSGYFRIWVQDASTGTLVWGSPTADAVQAVAGQTSYGMNWSVAQGAGTYKLWVYYYNADGTQAAKDVSNGTITINPAPTLTSPNAGDLLVGVVQPVDWTVNTPVSSGYFRIWLRDASTGTWVWGSPTADAVQAVAGQRSYSMNWSVAQQPGTYKLWVYYYNADGTQIAGDDSSGPVAILAP